MSGNKRDSNAITVAFDDDLPNALNILCQKSRLYPNLESVKEDVKRAQCISIKDQAGTTRNILEQVTKNEERVEKFLSEISNFPPVFQDFIKTHFHQGGRLMTGLRYAAVYVLNGRGYAPTGDPRTDFRRYTFELKANELIFEEIFDFRQLNYFPLDHGHSRCRINLETKEEGPECLEKDKIDTFKREREYLEKKLGSSKYSAGEVIFDKDGKVQGLAIDKNKVPFPETNNQDDGFLLRFGLKRRFKINSQGALEVMPIKPDDITYQKHKFLVDARKHASVSPSSFSLSDFLENLKKYMTRSSDGNRRKLSSNKHNSLVGVTNQARSVKETHTRCTMPAHLQPFSWNPIPQKKFSRDEGFFAGRLNWLKIEIFNYFFPIFIFILSKLLVKVLALEDKNLSREESLLPSFLSLKT